MKKYKFRMLLKSGVGGTFTVEAKDLKEAWKIAVEGLVCTREPDYTLSLELV